MDITFVTVDEYLKNGGRLIVCTMLYKRVNEHTHEFAQCCKFAYRGGPSAENRLYIFPVDGTWVDATNIYVKIQVRKIYHIVE